MAMIPLTPHDLPVGQPLPWSLLDKEGNLLLGSGSVIADGREVALVFRHGSVYRLDIDAANADSADADGKGRPGAPPGPLGLQVGTLLQIKAPSDAGRAAASRLMGFVEQGLFVSWPQLGGRETQFQPGELVLLRGFSGQSIYSFSCTVTAVCRSPFRYLVLSAPIDVQQVPVRSSARVPTRLAAYVMEGDGSGTGTERLAVLSDLSTGGALVQSAAPVPHPGTQLRLRFQLRTAAADCEIALDAWTRNVSGEPQDSEFPSFSVAFDVLGERELALLQCYIYEQLLSSASMRV